MADPVSFTQQNQVLLAAPGTESFVRPLPICRTENELISCWRLSWRERWEVLCHGRVYLRVLSQTSQPPVEIQAVESAVFLVDPRPAQRARLSLAVLCFALVGARLTPPSPEGFDRHGWFFIAGLGLAALWWSVLGEGIARWRGHRRAL